MPLTRYVNTLSGQLSGCYPDALQLFLVSSSKGACFSVCGFPIAAAFLAFIDPTRGSHTSMLLEKRNKEHI